MPPGTSHVWMGTGNSVSQASYSTAWRRDPAQIQGKMSVRTYRSPPWAHCYCTGPGLALVSRTLQFGSALASCRGTAGPPELPCQHQDAAICTAASAWRRASAPERRRSPDCRCSAVIDQLPLSSAACLPVHQLLTFSGSPSCDGPAASANARVQQQPSQNWLYRINGQYCGTVCATPSSLSRLQQRSVDDPGVPRKAWGLS